jgi:type II secretory pathway component PulJ
MLNQLRIAERSGSQRYSRGVTLLEALISLALGVIVTGAMVSLMGNSMGSATRIIEMSQLTDELRNTMHLVTRDIRRANYSPLSHLCYGNSDCGSDGTITGHGDISISSVLQTDDCVTFDLDRAWDDDGGSTNNDSGGFRRTLSGGVGVIEMWIGDASPNCNANSDDWVAVTDPGFVDITQFTVDDDDSFEDTVSEEGGATFNQRVRQINITVSGQLIMDNDINRTLIDEIRVRNDFISG